MIKKCEWCGKDFEVDDTKHGRNRRFCGTSCSAYWRNKTYGPNKLSDEARQKAREFLQNKWKDPEFRKKKIQYMIEDNPVYKEGVIEKATKTRLKNGSYQNNFKYGNGKISEYEQLVFDFLIEHGFYYNYAIPTKTVRHRFPEEHYSYNYKPDFVNLDVMLCVEIDGNNHMGKKNKAIDIKKEKCLELLGYKTIRFTHEYLDKNYAEFEKEILNEISK